MPQPPTVRSLFARLVHALRHADGDTALLLRAGALLFLSGLVHVGVWWFDGAASLDGPVSWRKPIVFGLSSGVTTLSLAWLAAWTEPTAARTRWSRAYVATMVFEILLIDVQRWRGVGSHFNTATPLDGAIFTVMGVTILASMAAALMLGRTFLRSGTVPADVRTAGRLAMGFLMLGAAVGIGISVHGSMVQATGTGTPSMVGLAGQLKVVHAIPLHALQVFPVLVALLALVGLDEATRVRRLQLAGVGYGLLFVAMLGQALLGRAPTDLAPGTAAMLGVGVVLLVASLRPSRVPLTVSSPVPTHLAKPA